jgi:tetratricopeptide (TPR) repeat protein
VIAARSGDPLLAAEALQLRCALLVQRDRTDACAPLLARAEAALDPRDPEQAGMIAQGLYLGARDLLHQNRHEDIVANSRRALALLDHAPARRELRAELHDTLAFSLVKLDRAAEAEALLRPLVDELAAAGDAQRALAEAQDTLAGALFAQGQNEEGLRLREDSLRTLESLYGPDHSVLADNLINLGIAHYRAGQLDRAEEVLERAVRVARTKGDTQASALLAGLASLGTVEFLRRADQDARNHLDESIALATRLQRPVDAGRALRWRGIVGFAEGRAAEARADFEQSLALLSPMHPPEHATILQTRTLMLALRFASAGPAERAPGGCEEAGDLARRFVAAAGADDPDARIAQSLDRLCTAETGQAEATLVGLSAALPAEDYRQRLVARLAAAWTPTPGRSAL